MTDAWQWPDPPITARDIIAGHCRNWGKTLAYELADTLLIELARGGFQVIHVKETTRKPFVFDNEDDAAEAMDNGRNTGGKSYRVARDLAE